MSKVRCWWWGGGRKFAAAGPAAEQRQCFPSSSARACSLALSSAQSRPDCSTLRWALPAQVIPKVRDGLTQLSKATEEHKPILGHLLWVAAHVSRAATGDRNGHRCRCLCRLWRALHLGRDAVQPPPGRHVAAACCRARRCRCAGQRPPPPTPHPPLPAGAGGEAGEAGGGIPPGHQQRSRRLPGSVPPSPPRHRRAPDDLAPWLTARSQPHIAAHGQGWPGTWRAGDQWLPPPAGRPPVARELAFAIQHCVSLLLL